ncbi:MAG: rane protein of unknown function [Candidatus Saccharibacteria bacterium]|nr:rane protein of unknown function [Candidatus Saccharibacteria bacterium]
MLKTIFKKRQSILPLDKPDWLILIVGLIIFVTTSLATITKSSIWFDEAFGAYLIRFDFWHIATYTASDVHPPLYYWMLKLWSLLFGTSEFALRSMSVLFAAIAITFGFLTVKRLLGRKAAWLGLLFMILSPMLVRYSQEMRMYTMVTAIALAATYVLTIATESKRRLPWIVYGVLVGLGMWTHYFTALVWLAHWVWRAWTVREKHKKRQAFIKAFFIREWILAHIVAVGIFLPWLPSLVWQLAIVQANGFWIPPVIAATIPNFLTNVLYYQDQETVNPWATLFLIILAITMVTFAVRLLRRLSGDKRRGYMLILAIAFVPVTLLFLASMPPLRSSFVDRYLIPSTLAIPLFAAVTLALSSEWIKPILQKALAGLMVIAMVFGIFNVYQLGNYNKTLHSSNNTRQTIEALVAKAGDGQPIIADSPWLFYEAVFYSTDNHPVYFIDANTEYKFGSLNMLRDNDQHKIKDLDAFAKVHPVIWYLGRPGNNSLTPPKDTWMQISQVEVNDSVSNKPSYKAVEYLAN